MSLTPPTLLVLHGITMNAASMRQRMGPLADELEGLGLELVFPEGAHRQSDEEVGRLLDWIRPRYAARGLDAEASFAQGRFWLGPEHHDWFDGQTDPVSGRKVYRAVGASLSGIAQAASGRRVVGLLGFSQGAAMAAVVAARAARGELELPHLCFGVFLGGFLPRFDVPEMALWPVPGQLPCLVAVGDADGLFPGGHAALAPLADALPAGAQERVVFAGLEHDLPRTQAQRDVLLRFVEQHLT